MRLFLLIAPLLLAYSISAQNIKDEREERINTQQVPSAILEKLAKYDDQFDQLKYYKETDGKKVSIEAKARFRGNFYSIEFSDSSILEDVEKTVRFKEVKTSIQKNIQKHLSRYKKHKIDRAQIQFSGSSFSDQEVIDQAINHDRGEIIHYELEVFIREKRRWSLHEMLFDSLGSFVSQRQIINRSSDFILFDE